MRRIIRLIDSIRLNLGIKTFFRKRIWTEENLCKLDNSLIFPIYKFLDTYFYRRINFHYGADYKWGDEKSQNLNHKKKNQGYGLLHYAFIRNQKPKRILCVGSMYGFIPFMMAAACRDNGRGHVDFVDVDFDMRKDKNNNYYGQGFWHKTDIQKHFSYLGADKYITTHLMKSEDFGKTTKEKYDYIYLDGDHSYKGAIANIKAFWPKLNREGFMIFHDISFDRILRNMLFEHGKLFADLTPMPFKFILTNHYSGLGFIQKLTNDNPLDFVKK